jgi:hypothetical protein
MIERRESGEYCETQHITAKPYKFIATKVPSQCPLVIMLKVNWRENKSEVDKVEMKSGARRGVEQGPTALSQSREFRHETLGGWLFPRSGRPHLLRFTVWSSLGRVLVM